MSKRVALLIGNEEYGTNARSLRGPRQDVSRMAKLLDDIDFGVVKTCFNADQGTTRKNIEGFIGKLEEGTLFAFYYSGHGIQAPDGANHLMPVDAKIYDPIDIENRCYPVSSIVELLKKKKCTGLLFLDACRDDPFKGMSDEERTKSVVIHKAGLATPNLPKLADVLISYAAESGDVALDGDDGAHSPYTEALIEHLPTPGLSVEDALKRVRKTVANKTEFRQRPDYESKLVSCLVLVPDATELVGVPATETTSTKGSGTSIGHGGGGTGGMPPEWPWVRWVYPSVGLALVLLGLYIVFSSTDLRSRPLVVNFANTDFGGSMTREQALSAIDTLKARNWRVSGPDGTEATTSAAICVNEVRFGQEGDRKIAATAASDLRRAGYSVAASPVPIDTIGRGPIEIWLSNPPGRLIDGLPGETAWIYAGELDKVANRFKKEPVFIREGANLPAIDVQRGEWIRLSSSRKTMILDFNSKGISRAFDSPFTRDGKITYTCTILPPGQRLYVADVKVNGPSPGEMHMWLRIRNTPPGS